MKTSRSLFLSLFALGWILSAAGGESAPALSTLQARPTPEWVTHGVMYQIWLRSFTPEGTLRAATKRLPAVAELGATIIYLSPVCLQDADMRREFWSTRQKASETNNPRNPYRIKDYNRIDPEYGDEDDLRTFVSTAHKLGMHVLMDLVYFHCGPTSVLMKHPDYFKHDASGKISTGEWHFPVLNYQSHELREHLWANMVHWVKDFDVDGFRCDVGDMVPLDFWEEGRNRIEAVKPGRVILSEGERLGDQVKAFDLNYSFTWFHATINAMSKGVPASSLQKIWEQQRSVRPQGSRFIRFSANHDFVNDLEHVEVVCGDRAASAVAMLNFSIDGVPFIYSGQEIGDTSRQSIYARWPIRWEAACLPRPKAKLAFFQKLCQLRHSEAALTEGELLWLTTDQPDSVVALLRRAGDRQILSVINLSNRTLKVQVELPAGCPTHYESALSEGAKVSPADGKLAFALEGFGCFMGRK